MRMYDLIEKKRRGLSLSKNELHWIIREYTNDHIPDYQISALLMAICFQGMNEEETLELTLAMRNSGDILDLSQIHDITADKHSTGGVGDKVSLIFAPLAASCGIPIAKMSGRGLGHTGGTIDKLHSISGFTTNLTETEFINNVNTIGIALMEQTKDLAPADKKLYALRDVTATVEESSLIASSIMSKKLAAGADCIILDVKCGSGAFMKTFEQAEKLAESMVHIGKGAGKQTAAVISNMDQPLGFAVGNALEVQEAIDVLQGNGPLDVRELVLLLVSHLLIMTKKASSLPVAKNIAQEHLDNKKALKKFQQWISCQHGDPLLPLPKASIIQPVFSKHSGYVSKISADQIGSAVLLLGGGRKTKEDSIDLAVGVILKKKLGDYVKKEEPLAYIHANSSEYLEKVSSYINEAYEVTDLPIKLPPLILDTIL
ncbi:MAG: thymidine phosphorylase [Lachnospiraceae bacterium]|nr:thymidine phosphorylase [Lachnospiraceae bacterium]